MNNLDIIEQARGGPFVVRANGVNVTVPDPADVPYMHVMLALMTGWPPGLPEGISSWQASLLGQRWAAHYDLPDLQSAQRLAYLVEQYRSAIVADLRQYHGVDFGELWRARRWRTALDLIDHLPSHSWYASAVSSDEEHAKMLAESMAARENEGEKSPAGPPMHTWTPEVSAITSMHDTLRNLIFITLAANGDKTAKQPEPLPRPNSPVEKALKSAQFELRKQRHQALVARMLPHKAEMNR